MKSAAIAEPASVEPEVASGGVSIGAHPRRIRATSEQKADVIIAILIHKEIITEEEIRQALSAER